MAHWILHMWWSGCRLIWRCSISLFPFWLTRRVPSNLLWVGLASWSAHEVVTHGLALCHDATEATRVWEDFILGHVCTASKILASDQIFLFTALMDLWIICLICVVAWLVLSFNIYWRLRSDSVFCRCWAGFLRISSMLLAVLHHLSAYASLMAAWYSSSHEVIMLLYQTKGIRWRPMPTVMMGCHFLICKTLCVRTCRPLLCGSWPQSSCTISLVRSDATLTSFIRFLRSVSWTSRNFPSSHHLSRRLHTSSMKLIHLKCGCPDGSTSLKYSKLLVENLRVSKALIARRLTQMRRPHHLLRHH